MRTTEEIENEILAYKNNEPELDVLTSKGVVWRAFIRIIAKAVQTLESIFEKHKSQIKEITDIRLGSVLWYKYMTLKYQNGRALVDGENYYDNKGLSDEEIKELQIVKYAAANEASKIVTTGTGDDIRSKTVNYLQVKVSGKDRNALTPDILRGIETYLQQISYAGVRIEVTTGEADKLTGTITVHYNPAVMNGNGESLKNGNEPVRTAIDEYLLDLPFNAEFSIMQLIDRVQKVEGVVLVHVKYIQIENNQVNDRYTPENGFLRVYDKADLTINYVDYYK